VKSKDLNTLPLEDLEGKLADSVKSLYELRLKTTMKEQSNTASIKTERRNIARIKQAIDEKRKTAGGPSSAS
jgi:ribosomal protein L29